MSLQFDATSSSESGNTQTIAGTLRVTGGKGSFANLGGTGTMTIVTAGGGPVTFTASGSITLGGALTKKVNVFPSGVANVFSDTRRLAPGAWAWVFGENLASASATWNGDFPLTLGGVSAKLDGKDIYFWFVSPDQINFQVPDGTKTGCVAFVLNTPNGSDTRNHPK